MRKRALVHLHGLTVLRGFRFIAVFSCSFGSPRSRVRITVRSAGSLMHSAFNSRRNVTAANKVRGILAAHPCGCGAVGP